MFIMTLTKAEITKSLKEQIRLEKRKKGQQQPLFPELYYESITRKRATDIVEAMFEIIKKSLERGESVIMTGFGKFQVKFKWARKGRNPQTGEQIILKSRRIVTFKCSPKLRDKINNG